jgi:hypothetical protein
MAARDIPRNRKPQPRIPGVLAQVVAQPVERAEHIVPSAGGMPGPSSSTSMRSQSWSVLVRITT